jgi:hypothetical protein
MLVWNSGRSGEKGRVYVGVFRFKGHYARGICARKHGHEGRMAPCVFGAFFLRCGWSSCNSDLSSQFWAVFILTVLASARFGGFRSGRVSLTWPCSLELMLSFEHNPDNRVRHTDLPCQAIHPSVCQLIALNWMMICTSGTFLFINQTILFRNSPNGL